MLFRYSAAGARSVKCAAVHRRFRIVLLPGDGIGPEIVGATRRLLEALGDLEFEDQLLG
jgi:hypothetical protein